MKQRASTARSARQPVLAEDMHYGISEDAHDRLWRAQQAVQLLSALNHDVAHAAGFSEDGPAAVAEYVARDLADVLGTALPIHAPRRRAGGAGPDH